MDCGIDRLAHVDYSVGCWSSHWDVPSGNTDQRNDTELYSEVVYSFSFSFSRRAVDSDYISRVHAKAIT